MASIAYRHTIPSAASQGKLAASAALRFRYCQDQHATSRPAEHLLKLWNPVVEEGIELAQAATYLSRA